MPLELNATDQFNSFLRFAQESQAAGKETAIARRGNIYNPFFASTVVAAEKDGVGGFAALFRSSSSKKENDVSRELFRESVADIFGGEARIPDSVKAAMKLDDYGSGKPLTARRILAVKAAIDAAAERASTIYDTARANAGNTYLHAGEEGRALVDARIREAVMSCGGDHDVEDILAASADRILLGGDYGLRSSADIAKRLADLRADFEELRRVAKGDPALLAAGKAFLAGLGGKSAPEGLITRLFDAAKSAKTGAMKSLGPSSNPLAIHKAVRQFDDSVTAAMFATGVFDVFDGADETGPCRNLLQELILLRCGRGTLQSMQAALTSQESSKLLSTYHTVVTGDFNAGDISPELRTTTQSAASLMDRSHSAFLAAVNGVLGEVKADPPLFRGRFDHVKAKSGEVLADLVDLGRIHLRESMKAYLDLHVKGSGPVADLMRELYREKLGGDRHDPGEAMRQAQSRCALAMLNWNTATDARMFALGDLHDTQFAKDVIRDLDVELAGVGKLSNESPEAARDQIARFVAGGRDVTYDGLDDVQKRKAHLVMSLLSQNNERAGFDGTAHGFDPEEKMAAFALAGHDDAFTRQFSLSFSPQGDLELVFRGVKTDCHTLVTPRDGKVFTVPREATFEADYRLTIPGAEFDRLATVDFAAFDDAGLTAAFKADQGPHRLTRAVDGFPKAFQFGGGVTCVAETYFNIPDQTAG
jgi:hypothetical protein